jgi:mannose-6-phosphate isomerase-like protein (cupin superfamily)
MQVDTPINFVQALTEVTDYWSPRVVAQVNNQYVKVAKVKGEFTWHKHDDEDELFLVIYGRLVIQFEGHSVTIDPGECYVVPKGTLHNPVAEEECGMVLVETVTTKHTGDVVSPLTKTIEQQIGG